jgi:serine/threonine protein kinase
MENTKKFCLSLFTIHYLPFTPLVMTPEQWQKVEQALQGALDLPPQDRAFFLDLVCAGDEQLKQEAASLISAHEEAGNFIEEPAIVNDAHILVGENLTDNIGREIGAYKIIAPLGSGGMGEVYLAEDLRLNRRVALKLLPPYFASDDGRLGRFQREARAASGLNHPNILTIFEVGESEGVRFIATEFIDGQTLRQLIAQQDLTLDEILDVATQVAAALTVAHAAGIIHRDIKPENIMRRADGIVKILDFGIAKLMEPQPYVSEADGNNGSQTETGVIVGTVGYMSPEQGRALAVDERTDIWSLGVVLYEMLVHRLPFTGATRMDTMVNILEREAPTILFAEGSPVELQRLGHIVEKTLKKDRNERFQSATELLAELKNVGQELELQGILKRHSISYWLPSATGAQSLAGRPLNSVPHSSAPVPSSAISSGEAEFAHLSNRRYRSYVLGISVLMLAMVATPFLYRRSIADRKTNTVSVAGTASDTSKLYARMSEAEQLAFIERQAERIATLMGDHPVKLDEESVRAVKGDVDRYVARTGSQSLEPGKEDLRIIYGRARPYVTLIASSFAARKIPVVVGIYLPMIESEYKNCFENRIGAKGLFQFMPRTAKHYGVAEQDMCDVEKMTPAAAHYVADRMAELGDDSESMTLVLLSYNRGPEWVRNALRELRGTDNYQRNFWTLFAHRDQLDATFRNENAAYVPAFFASAIIGENPQNFELPGPPLSEVGSEIRGQRSEVSDSPTSDL